MRKMKFFQKETTLEIISALLILLFLYTGISKLYDLPNFERVLKGSPLLRNYATFVSWSIPSVEIVICVLLFLPRFRTYGLYSSFIIMALFTAYIGYMLLFTPNLPCSCGGVISLMSWKQHLIFNTAFLILSGLGILIDKRIQTQKNRNINGDQYPVFS